jgi:hypothetical protein
MRKVAMLAPLSFALLLLACGKNDPVAEDAVAPPDGLVGDASATGLAAPANSAAAEAARQAALPPASGGMTWSFRQPDRAALFGPPGSPAFSIQCQRQREGPSDLIFIRYLPPAAGGQATLSFTGNGQAASVPVAAVSDPTGTSGHWRAVVAPGDIARDVAEAFAGQGPVNVSVTGLPSLVVPSADSARRVFAECLRG